MGLEHAEQRAGDDDRGGDHGPHAHAEQLVAPLVAADVRRGGHVVDDHGDPARAGALGDHGAGGRRGQRGDALVLPLGGGLGRAAVVCEPHDRAGGAERSARLGGGDREQRRHAQLGAHLVGDAPDDPLPLERALELGRGARPLESERRLAAELLDEAHLARREPACLLDGHGAQDGDHALAGHERREDAALRAHDRADARVDERRGLGVEDDERRSVEDDARDAGGLGVEVHHRLGEPLLLLPVEERDAALRAPPVDRPHARERRAAARRRPARPGAGRPRGPRACGRARPRTS